MFLTGAIYVDENIVSVYNLKDNSWRKSQRSPPRSLPTRCSEGIFVNGDFHWFGLNDIDALDLVSECFLTVPLPDSVTSNLGGTLVARLDAIVGSLCVIESTFYFHRPFYVLVMKQYRVQDSWVRIAVEYCNSPIPQVLPRRINKLLMYMGKKVASSDLQEEASEELIPRGFPDNNGAVIYEDTLIRLQEHENV